MKKNKLIRILSIILFFLFIGNVYIVKAEDKKIYNVEFNIVNNTDLEERDVNILLEYLDDKSTALVTLKSKEGYKKVQPLLEGEVIVKFVDIIGNVGQYSIEYNDQLVIDKDNLVFTLTINKDELESIDSDSKKNSNNKIIKESDENKEYNLQDDSDKKEIYKRSLFANLRNISHTIISTSIALIIVLVVFLIIRKRKGY